MSQYSNLDWQYPGLSDVGAYQVSGVPFVSAALTVPAPGNAPLRISFPYVTKFVTIQNTANGLTRTLRVGFSSNAVTSSAASGMNYFVLDNGESYTGEWRIEDIYLLSSTAGSQTSASIIAGLTNIPRGIPALGASSGNNWSGSSGVG